ncbi:MAG: heme exporter protein CcmD [Methylophilaceae bacterium]|nr:heme exporter protein CcmD [Methylophilaceae bacterium]
MQWQNWSAFFYMGGYGLYVWGSFGLTAICMVWEVVALRNRNQQALRLLRLLTQK